MFVGDSLNRGQFSSMVCLLQRVIPDGEKLMETLGSLTVFHAKVEPFSSASWILLPLLLHRCRLIGFLLSVSSCNSISSYSSLRLFIFHLFGFLLLPYLYSLHKGVQCHGGVLLGAFPPGVELR